MTTVFLTYKTFTDKIPAEEFGVFLSEKEIPYELEKSAMNFEFSNTFNEMSTEYRIKLRQEDFAVVNSLLQEQVSQQLDDVEKDHYLFSFTDDELIDIISKPDEWNDLDVLLAQRILKDRGKVISSTEVQDLNKKRLEDLSKPALEQKWWIIFGYTIAVFGGLFAIMIGWQLNTQKKTLPNGSRVFSYSENDRKHGFNIFLIGICCMVFWIGYRVLQYAFK